MGYDKNRRSTGLLPIRAVSGRFLSPMELGGQVLNFVHTAEGSLHSIVGPAPFLPDYGAGFPSLGRPHGIIHSYIGGSEGGGGYDVTLLHSGTKIRVFEGWNRAWRELVSEPGGSGDLKVRMESDNSPQYPTQFAVVPNGIIIVPQGRVRSMFYDGECVGFLGYERGPTCPIGHGPYSMNDTVSGFVPNYYGYTGNGPAGFAVTTGQQDIGKKYVGTSITNTSGTLAGTIKASAYQAAVQWIDRWGNLSPMSSRSATVAIDNEGVLTNIDGYLHSLLWSNIQAGPDGTVGRLLLHTKDMRNSGTTELYVVSQNDMAGVPGAYATFPDNVTDKYHYNKPDNTLVATSYDVVATPIFKVCCVAFGRLWVGGIEGDVSAVRASMPGRWGTFLADDQWYPDPTGGEITGFAVVSVGLLVFTRSSTHLIRPNQDGDGFVTTTVRTDVGCVAPSSIVDAAGVVLWLGRDGFYGFSEKNGIEYVSEDIEQDLKRINVARALQACAVFDPRHQEYRCWVPIEGNTECTYCFVFDMRIGGWRNRNTEEPVSVCVTRDHRQYCLMAGVANNVTAGDQSGVWVLDRQNKAWTPGARSYVVETSWIEPSQSKDVRSPKTVFLWLRETYNAAFTVEVFRDYRVTASRVYTDTRPTAIPSDDAPSLWGTARYNAATSLWTTRRLFWKKVDINLPSCEVFKVRITATIPFEFMGLSIDERPIGGSGRVAT